MRSLVLLEVEVEQLTSSRSSPLPEGLLINTPNTSVRSLRNLVLISYDIYFTCEDIYLCLHLLTMISERKVRIQGINIINVVIISPHLSQLLYLYDIHSCLTM